MSQSTRIERTDRGRVPETGRRGGTRRPAHRFVANALESLETRSLLSTTISGLSLNTPPTVIEGANATFSVSFIDTANGNNDTVQISWGDTLVSTMHVTSTGGTVTVPFTHTYTEQGKEKPIVTATDTINGDSKTLKTNFIVADAPLTSVGVTTTISPLLTFSGPIAEFHDADPNGTDADYTVKIRWRDGTSSTGVVVDLGGGDFVVFATHTYLVPGTYNVKVKIKDIDGPPDSRTITFSTIIV